VAGKHILIVDDEPGIVNILRIKLKLYGYEVSTSTSGAEAIELVRTQQPDIILLDVLMPDITGIEVIKKVRTFSQVPIIVFTAKPDTIRAAIDLGANDSINKPFDPDQVVKKIETTLKAAGNKQCNSKAILFYNVADPARHDC